MIYIVGILNKVMLKVMSYFICEKFYDIVVLRNYLDLFYIYRLFFGDDLLE